MNRNDIVTLDVLVEGDRFYKAGDKKKKVMAVVEVTSSRAGAVETVKICDSDDYKEEGFILKKTTVKNPRNYQVVFLRHHIDIA